MNRSLISSSAHSVRAAVSTSRHVVLPSLSLSPSPLSSLPTGYRSFGTKGNIVTASSSVVSSTPAPANLKAVTKDLESALVDDISDLTIAPDEGLDEYIKQQKYKVHIDPLSSEVMMTRTVGGYQIRIKFDSEIDEEANEHEGEGEEGEEGQDHEGQEEGEEGEEGEDKYNMPIHSFEVDVINTNKADIKSNYMHVSCYTDKEGQLCIESLLFDPELAPQNTPNIEKASAVEELLESGMRAKEKASSVLFFDDFSDETQDKLIAYLESMGIDDRLAQFIQHYAQIVRTQAFLKKINSLKNFLQN